MRLADARDVFGDELVRNDLEVTDRVNGALDVLDRAARLRRGPKGKREKRSRKRGASEMNK
jgi:hypothetical protein